MDKSGLEPETSRMLSGRDKPSTPYALIAIWLNYNIYAVGNICYLTLAYDSFHRTHTRTVTIAAEPLARMASHILSPECDSRPYHLPI